MVHNNAKARRHYLRLIARNGSYEERVTDARAKPPMGFVMRRSDLYKQPYAMPSTQVEEDLG